MTIRKAALLALLILVLTTPMLATTASAINGLTLSGGGSGSTRVVYTSALLGTTGDAIVAPGSTTTGTDRATAINAALSGGNVRLVVDGQYGLGASLVLYSNTDIQCLPGMGFIMKSTTNVPMIVNANPNAATTASGTGGYLVSNITDKNIHIDNCILNFNSTQAVTGSDPLFGTAHHVSAIDGKWVYGVKVLGVQNFSITNSTTYDSGAFSLAMSNIDGAEISRNHIYQPAGTAILKNTDGVHFIGPATNLTINYNRIYAMDDAIGLNADDSNRTGVTDAWADYMRFTGWQWGPITNVHANGNILDGGLSGIRLYSTTELMDQIFIGDTRGTVVGPTLHVLPIPALGNGNFGKIEISGLDVKQTETSTASGQNYIEIQGNTEDLTISNWIVKLPVDNTWPLLYQYGGTLKRLTFNNWKVDTTGSIFPAMIKTTGGAITSIRIDGLTWNDAASNTVSLFQGTTYPNSLAISNYIGPARILTAGYAPGNTSGDVFVPTPPVVSTITCQPATSLGTGGTVAISSGTYLQTSCYNDKGYNLTITGIKCYTDNNGTTTMNVTNGAGTGLLTGAVTCTNSYAAGTQSSTLSLAAGDFLKFTYVSDGASKQIVPLVSLSPPTILDLRTFTKVDSGSYLTVATTKVTATALPGNISTTRLYRDFGSAYFTGGFQHWFDFSGTYVSGGSACMNIYGLSNGTTNLDTSSNNIGISICPQNTGALTLYAVENYSSTQYASAGLGLTSNTQYFVKVTRSGTTYTVSIYSDASRTSLVGTQSLTLHSSVNYEYFYTLATINTGTSNTETVWGANYQILQ